MFNYYKVITLKYWQGICLIKDIQMDSYEKYLWKTQSY
jgi:hypothetical protein